MAELVNITDIIENIEESSYNETFQLLNDLLLKKKIINRNFSQEDFTTFIKLLFKNADNSEMGSLCRKNLRSLIKTCPEKIKFFQLVDLHKGSRIKALSLIRDLDMPVMISIYRDESAVDYLRDLLSEKFLSKIAVKSQKDDDKDPTEVHLIITHLQYLEKLYKYASDNNYEIEKFHLLVFEKVIPLTHHDNKKLFSAAIQLLMSVFKTNFRSYIEGKHINKWNEYKTNLIKSYCNCMINNIKKANLDWSVQWCFHVQLIGRQLFDDDESRACLFNVIKHSFHSSDKIISKIGYETWTQMIDVSALNPMILSSQIDFLMKPFLSGFSIKSQSVFIEVLKCWWHLIVILYSANESDLIKVVPKFLEFSFGLIESDKENKIIHFVEKYSDIKELAIDGLLQILVNEESLSEITTCFDDRLPDSILPEYLLKMRSVIINSLEKATIFIETLNNNKIDREDLIKKCQLLWSSVINLVKKTSSDKIFTDILLLIEKLIIIEDNKENSILNGILDSIIEELNKLDQLMLLNEEMTMNFLKKLLTIVIQTKEKKVHNSTIDLISNLIKKKRGNNFYSLIIDFILTIFDSLIPIINDNNKSNIDLTFVNEVWCLLAARLNRYLKDIVILDIEKLFDSRLKFLIKFLLIPLLYNSNNHFEQQGKIIKNWKDLYNEIENQSLKFQSDKPNLILDLLTSTIIDLNLLKNKLSNVILINFVNIMMGNFNYKYQLSKDDIPSVIEIINGVTKEIFLDAKNYEFEVVTSIKILYPLINSIFLRDKDQAILILNKLSSTMTNLFQINIEKKLIENEIVSVWRLINRVISFAKSGMSTPTIQTFLEFYCAIENQLKIHPNNNIRSSVLMIIETENKKKLSKAASESSLINLEESEGSEIRMESSINNFDNIVNENIELMDNAKRKSLKKECSKRVQYEFDEDYVPRKKRALVTKSASYTVENDSDNTGSNMVEKENKRKSSVKIKKSLKLPTEKPTQIEILPQPEVNNNQSIEKNNQSVEMKKSENSPVTQLTNEIESIAKKFTKVKCLLKSVGTPVNISKPSEAITKFMENPEEKAEMIKTLSEKLSFQEVSEIFQNILEKNKKEIN